MDEPSIQFKVPAIVSFSYCRLEPVKDTLEAAFALNQGSKVGRSCVAIVRRGGSHVINTTSQLCDICLVCCFALLSDGRDQKVELGSASSAGQIFGQSHR